MSVFQFIIKFICGYIATKNWKNTLSLNRLAKVCENRHKAVRNYRSSSGMATISLASAKGGVGKTTLAILIAAELALAKGWKVALLDSDLNQHASAFGKRTKIS